MGYVHASVHLAYLALGWLQANILNVVVAEQAIAVVVLAGFFFAYAPPLRRYIATKIDLLPSGPAQQILIPLGNTAPWLALLFTFWFTTLVFETNKLGTGVLRLAANMGLAWVIITLISRLVRNERLARALAVLAFAVAALNIAGLIGPVLTLLDSMAFYVGALRISILLLIKGAITLSASIWAAGAAARLVDVRLKHLQDITPAMQVLTSKIIRFTLLTLAVVFALGSVGIDLTAFALFSGAVGVGIGFGLQKVVSNLVSGVILLIDRSIKPGDVIEVEGRYGWITGLNARYVSLATRDGKEILIPNENLITEKVTNWSFSNNLIRQYVLVGISYGSDLHLAMRLAIEAAEGVPRALKDPHPVCLLKEFGDSSVNLELRFWIRDPSNGTANVRSAVMLRIWDLFHANGIEFPFPQRDLTLRNPEALADALARASDHGAAAQTSDHRSAAQASDHRSAAQASDHRSAAGADTRTA
jgi:small-conductance mechanosensitive channel